MCLNRIGAAELTRLPVFCYQEYSVRQPHTSIVPEDFKMRICIPVKRHYVFHAINIFFILFLFTCTSWVTFLLEIDKLGERISFVMTLILTFVAFKFMLAGSLPSTSYTTEMDKYILGCFLMLFSIMLEVGVAHWIFRRKDLDAATSFEIIFTSTLLCLWCALHVFFFWRVFRINTDANRRLPGEVHWIPDEKVCNVPERYRIFTAFLGQMFS